MQPTIRILAASILLAIPCSAFAVHINYSVDLGLMYSDNIALTATDPVGESVLIPGLNFELTEEGSAVQAQIDGMIEYRDYLGNEFGNEFRGMLDGTVNWVLLPERLDWSFADNFGLYPVDLRAPDTPDNLQQTNVFSTGPTLHFRIDSATEGKAELYYVDTRAQESGDFDSQRLVAALRGFHDLGPTSTISANLVAENVDFTENLLANDYAGYSLFAGYVDKLSQIDLDFALGYTHLNFDRGDDASGPLLRAGIEWRASERNSFSLNAASEYTDVASSLAAGGGLEINDDLVGASTIGNDAITPDVYQVDRIEIGYHYVASRLNVAALARYATYRYENLIGLPDNRDESGLGFSVGYLLQPRLTLGVIAEGNYRDFTVTNTSERDYRFGTYLTQQLGPHWSWRVDLARYDRNGDGNIESYDENSVYFRFIYER